MTSKDSKELLTSASQLENVENDVYVDDALTTSEKKEDLLTEVGDDKMNERENEDEMTDTTQEVNTNIAVPSALSGNTVETSSTMVDEKVDEGGDKVVGNDKKVEAVNNSSKDTKKVVRKRKKNAEEVSSPSQVLKKKMSDTSAVKIIKEAVSCDKSIEGNAQKELKNDEKLESDAIPGDEKEKSGTEDKKVVKKIVKKKIVLKGAESADVAVVVPSSSIPEVKDVEGAKDNSSIDAGKLNNADKTSPSTAEKKADDAKKQSKKVDGMGLVFMCNAKTKKDCFKYNVLGLPKSKKDLVAKIYKGMRLFLFDVDLKLMYGIYKAAGPGGYNIEPKAFDSKFPSQVRFTILKDCLPLPEEKFKAAIKDNYYKRNQFNPQLSAEQVRNLCKLFQSATGSDSKQTRRTGGVREATAREVNRRPVGRYAREAYRSPPRVLYQSPPRVRYPSPPPHPRYFSPPPRAWPVQALSRAPPHPYAYEQPADDYYRRDRPGALEPLGYQDPYIMYREPARYPEPAYPPTQPPAYASRLRQPRSPLRYPY